MAVAFQSQSGGIQDNVLDPVAGALARLFSLIPANF
jgi:hypothetical protein